MLETAKARPLLQWCEANASLFISAASLTHVVGNISKLPGSQSDRAKALRNWLDDIIVHFADRISGRRRDRHPRRRAAAELHPGRSVS
jgi:hypothetical protein